MSAALALWLLAASAREGDPFAEALAAARQAGLSPVARAETRAGGDPLLAVIFSRGEEQELHVYSTRRGKAYLVHLHPGSGERLQFEAGPGGSPFLNLLGDGSTTLLYRARRPALGGDTLQVLRYDKPLFSRLGSFPEGRVADVDGDGRPEIIARRRPLGRWLVLGCDVFAAMSDGVVATEVRSWRAGRFEDESARQRAFFSREIAREEAALRARPDPARYGAYAARALSLYYLYAARGDGREGWRRFSELISPPDANPATARCLGQVKADLRRRLEIPADWP